MQGHARRSEVVHEHSPAARRGTLDGFVESLAIAGTSADDCPPWHIKSELVERRFATRETMPRCAVRPVLEFGSVDVVRWSFTCPIPVLHQPRAPAARGRGCTERSSTSWSPTDCFTERFVSVGTPSPEDQVAPPNRRPVTNCPISSAIHHSSARWWRTSIPVGRDGESIRIGMSSKTSTLPAPLPTRSPAHGRMSTASGYDVGRPRDPCRGSSIRG